MKHLLFLFITLITFQSYSQEAPFEKGELLVQLRPSGEEYFFFRSFESSQQIGIEEIICLSPIVNIYQIKFEDPAIDLNNAIRLFYQCSEVLNAQKNHLVSDRETIPNDTLFDNLWHIKNVGQTGGTIDADVDGSDAWDITTGGVTTHNDTIVVCIIEASGVDINHVDLKGNMWKNYAEIPGNLIDDDNNGYVDDFNGWNIASGSDVINTGSHGTRVAGMVGASGNNTTGVVGINWNVKMMIVEGQNASNEASVIAAYNYPLTMRKMYNESLGQEGAFVVVTNASWGIDNGVPADAPLWCAMYDSLGSYGILNVAATTNSNTNVDIQGDLPTTCTSDYLIAVTMTNSNDVRGNSGYGTTHIDLGAPGYNVYSTSPGGVYNTVSGTSFASPLVAGSVALAYSTPCAEFINFAKYDPAGAALAMRAYILDGTDYKANLATEVATGGRLNIANTIDSIMANCDPSSCIPPYNVIASSITDSSVTINWQGFSTDYIVYFQEGSGPIIEIPISGATTYQIDTLIPCTSYSVWIAGDCTPDTSNYSFPAIFESDGCCKNPNLELVYASEDSLVIGWPSVLYATTYEVRYRKEGEALWANSITNASSPITLSGLEACTNYEFQIKTTCTDSTHGFSTTYVFNTLGCGACTEKTYCAVNGSDTQFEWIDHIALNGFANATGDNNGWYQSDQIICALTPGNSYPMEISAGYSGFNFSERFSVWIDLDQNGVFDPGEILINDENATGTLLTTLTIPPGSQPGVTKMRIGMRALTGPDPCPAAAYFGEYEHYCVYIGPQSGLEENDQHFLIYPNPAKDMVVLEYSGDIQSISIVSQDGKTVYFKTDEKEELIDISLFAKGIYLITVTTEEGSYTKKLIKQ